MRSRWYEGSHFLLSDIFFAPRGHIYFIFRNEKEFRGRGSRNEERKTYQQQQKRRQAGETTRKVEAGARNASFINTKRFMAGTLQKVERAPSLARTHVGPRIHARQTKPTAVRPAGQPSQQRFSASVRELFERGSSQAQLRARHLPATATTRKC